MILADPTPGEARIAARAKRRPRQRLHECCVELEVPFHDVDALRLVWHGHYYKYMELARTRLLRSRGLDGGDLLALGHGFLIIESSCRYAAPLRYGDCVRVSAWLRDVKHRVVVAYELTNLTRGVRAAKARTVLVTTNRDGQLLLRTPEVILERLAPSPSPAEDCDKKGRSKE
jgi:acyl-CoA thioester hydrolase